MTIQHDWDRLEGQRVPTIDAARLPWVSVGRGRMVGPAMPAALSDASAMSRGKRLFDVGFAVLLLVPLSLVMAVVAGLLLIKQGRPIFYAAPRMRGVGEEFTQWKFRTMVCDDADSGASGAHKDWRITAIGRVLRRSRIDELPQLFNILRGDMSFVGPRPPLREYVERFPLDYAQTLQCRPGVTGLATLIYHRHEDRIMASCDTAEATEAAYYRRCLPAKFRIDSIYVHRSNVWLDLWIIWQTLLTVLTDKDVGTRKRLPQDRRRAVVAGLTEARGGGSAV